MSQDIPELKLLLPIDGGEHELIVSSEFVKNVILPGVEHEVGHIVAAAHFGAYLVGIGVGFIQKPGRPGMFFQAIYGWEACPITTQCLVKAAGPAADLLYRGKLMKLAPQEI